MTGGKYYTWFDNNDSEIRKVLYALENLGIAKLIREKKHDKGWYKYKWELTDKGKKIVRNDKNLRDLWEGGRILEFHEFINRKDKVKNFDE